LSGTWNVAKLISKTCSSAVTHCATDAAAADSKFVSPIVADVPLASERDNPAAPSTGMALLRRFSRAPSFMCGIIMSSLMFAPRGSCTIIDSSRVTEAHAGIDYAAGKGPRGSKHPEREQERARAGIKAEPMRASISS
jgi:hypothetical protein